MKQNNTFTKLQALLLVLASPFAAVGCAGTGDLSDDDTGNEQAVGTAQQALTWYQKCEWEYNGLPALCVDYTGGWPSGTVRAEAPSYYGVRLMTSTKPTGPWSVVKEALGYKTYTASATPGKYNYYITCAKQFSSSSWFCMHSTYGVYLGD